MAPAVPAMAAPVATPAVADAGVTAIAAGWGLCQCIADNKYLDFHCPGSADACRSTCGTLFSFKPDARCHAGAQ
ncbi:MAG TPA: hypothetical protein VMB84_15390 [Stellaceae bacterium]|nr:hypothetical protein [Stellaceae bacterium]